jgi:hypothetical protein
MKLIILNKYGTILSKEKSSKKVTRDVRNGFTDRAVNAGS